MRPPTKEQYVIDTAKLLSHVNQYNHMIMIFRYSIESEVPKNKIINNYFFYK